MKVNLSEKSKAEFIDHISKQSINCWFEGDEFVMPCGQGKASKGIVLYQLSVWQLKQDEIEEKDKRIADLELALTQIKSWESHPKNYGIDFGSWGLRDFYRDLADKALRGEHESI